MGLGEERGEERGRGGREEDRDEDRDEGREYDTSLVELYAGANSLNTPHRHSGVNKDLENTTKFLRICLGA